MRVHTLLIYLLFLSVFILPSMARAEYSQEPTKNLQAQTIESANGLTLQTALTLALEANPEISVAIREREAIEGVVTQAGTRPNPSISTSIQDTRRDTRQVFLQLNQEIELGNKREARIEAADAFYNKASAKLESKKAEIHANVVTTFYEVLAGQERLKLSRSSVEVANLALDAASKRVKAGKSSPVEETKSKIAESSAKIEFNQAASQLSSARKRLSALWGNPLPVFESAQGDVENIPSVSSLADLSASLESSPAISLAKLEISARDSMTKIERSKATPNITISAGVLNNQELGGLNQALLGLSVPIPVFDRNQGNLQEAVSRQYKAQDELVAVRAQLLANLATQYERLNSARQTSESLRSEILPGAQSAFDAANKGFN
ncbi:MAG: cobalt-zinc-cadmium resistance protein, partial [Mehylophilales bacterium 35-46-6]